VGGKTRLQLRDPGPWKEPEGYLLTLFSRLRPGGFALIGPVDPNFNCIGHADGSEENCCVPESIDAYVQHFRAHGFVECYGPDSGSGAPMVAIFAHGVRACHAALRIDGKWTSKIGGGVTIQHELDDLIGDRPTEYGRIVRYMRKQRQE
jgi:hypothetical protein